jgi:transposase-like protein
MPITSLDGLEPVHCPRCRRLLARATPGAVRPGAQVQFKCGSCNAYISLEGEPVGDALPASPPAVALANQHSGV